MARIAGIAAAVALLIGGCSGDDEGGTAPAPVSSPTAAAGAGVTSSPPSAAAGPGMTSFPVDDPPGLITCREVATALRDGTLMDTGVVDRITATSTTADAPVADAATRLADAFRTATTERGRPGEPDAVAAVSAAAAEMSEVCGESGLDSVRGAG